MNLRHVYLVTSSCSNAMIVTAIVDTPARDTVTYDQPIQQRNYSCLFLITLGLASDRNVSYLMLKCRDTVEGSVLS